MAKMKKNAAEKLWPEVSDADFMRDDNIVDHDIALYNLEKMKVFSFNMNVFRQILRLSDSLKPVQRRQLYAMYLSNARPGVKPQKCNQIVGNTMTWHPHGDIPIYKSLVGMTQPWKIAVPLIDGKGNFGNDAYPEMYAHSRYTEAKISKYAWECFFEDFDKDCVEQILNTSCDKLEPMSFPSKFPNILVNGGVGIAIGNSFRIPTYNINDIITLCKRLIENPEHPNIYMIPDLPTGCDVVDDGRNLREICETGNGTLRMRSTINVMEGVYEKKPVWILQVQNIPWMSSLTTIHDKIIELTKAGSLAIKETQNDSYQVYDQFGKVRMIIDYKIIVDKSHDPYKIRQQLYKMTKLEDSVSINFKVVMDGLDIDRLNMRDLVLSWVDERRAYKRRLLNKKISRLSSRLSLLEILIRLLEADNIEKTISIVKNSNFDEVVDQLKAYGNMTSYQATCVAEMRFNAFTKDAQAKYLAEKAKVEAELEHAIDMIKSEKKIDKIILEELDDLKKYASPRKSEIVSADTSIPISDTDHTVIITKLGMIKKLLYTEANTNKTPGFGAFKNADYPTHRVVLNNLDSLMFFDSFGRYSCIPVHEIATTETSSVGNRIYDYTRLDGEIVSASQYINSDTEEYIKEKLDQEINIVTLTREGYIKKTKIEEFTQLKSQKNVRAARLKDGDNLIYANTLMDSVTVIIYTKKGNYIVMSAKDIPLQGKDSMGVRSISLEDGDECVGLNVIGAEDEVLVVVTEKGNVKKCDLKYFVTNMKRKDSSYIATLDANDNVFFIDGAKEDSKLFVFTRTAYQVFDISELPNLSRKAKCQKKIAIPQGNNIITVSIQ